MSIYVGFRGDLRYGKESAFKAGTQSDLVNRFGLGQEPSRIDITREYDTVRQLGDRRLVQIIGRRERHAIGVNFILSRHDELGVVFKQQVDATTGNVTGYTYEEIPGTYAVGLLLGDTAGGQALLLFKGAVPSSFELNLRAGEPARASLSFTAAALDILTSGISLPAPSEGSSVYAAVADASNVALTLGNGAGFSGYITEARLRVNHNPELIWQIGGRQAVTWAPREYEIELELAAVFNDPEAIREHIEATGLNSVSVTVADVEGIGPNLTFSVSGITRITNLRLTQRVVEPAELELTVTARDLSVTLG